MCGQPSFGSQDNIMQGCSSVIEFQFCLAFLFAHPEHSVITVRLDSLFESSLLHEGQCMHYGEKFPYVVGAVHGTEMEYRFACGQVDASILHGAGIAATCSVYSPCVCPHLERQGQHGIIAIIRRIDKHITFFLAPLFRAVPYHSSISWPHWLQLPGAPVSCPRPLP